MKYLLYLFPLSLPFAYLCKPLIGFNITSVFSLLYLFVVYSFFKPKVSWIVLIPAFSLFTSVLLASRLTDLSLVLILNLFGCFCVYLTSYLILQRIPSHLFIRLISISLAILFLISCFLYIVGLSFEPLLNSSEPQYGFIPVLLLGLGNPNASGSLISLVVILLNYSCILNYRHRSIPLFDKFLFIVLSFSLVLTYSRSSALAVLIFFFFANLHYFRKKFIILLISLFALFLIVGICSDNFSFLLLPFQKLSDLKSESASVRYLLFQAIGILFVNLPLFSGYGYGVIPGMVESIIGYPLSLHNSFLSVCELGIFALFSHIFVFFTIFAFTSFFSAPSLS